ncbi:MAG: TRAP transporter large permease subunit [Clostridia bacterium]|nr:TRAP transporter large permease subunit [Clostridia bacterium]
MPQEVWYILALLATVAVTFLLLKRPIYECMFYGFVLMIALTGQWGSFFPIIAKTSTDTLFYSIVAFLMLAKILDATNAVDTIVALVCSIFGRVRGGAGYTAIIASTFMGALSGSGAGNVATTGVFTIPAMKKTGFPAHLAANVESSASTMGNMIPPSAGILAALACYNEFSGAEMSQSTFWVVLWGVSIWFVLQRIITLYTFCRIYKLKPMNAEDIPSFKNTLKAGWKNLLLPLIILLPFILDYFFKSTFFTERLGDGAKNLSSSLLLFTPGLAALYALLVNRKQGSKKMLLETAKKAVSGVVPVATTIFFAYCISNLFSETNIGTAVGELIKSWNLSAVALAFIIPLITAILGMVFPGTAQTKIFGVTIIGAFAAAGANPLLAAAMLPAITGAMEGMTPPLALCMYAAMGIAGSGMKETTKNCLVWVGLHYSMAVLCLLGVLPVLGL